MMQVQDGWSLLPDVFTERVTIGRGMSKVAKKRGQMHIQWMAWSLPKFEREAGYIKE